MPNIFVEMIEGRTLEQKRELAKQLTEAMVNVLKVEPELVNIRFLNVKREDLAKAGKLYIDR